MTRPSADPVELSGQALEPGPGGSPSAGDGSQVQSLLLERWLLGLSVMLNVVVALTAGHFPYHDANNHLARYVLIDRSWSAAPVPWVKVHPVPTPYIALDLVGVTLVHWLGPEGALRVLAVLPLIALPAGMYALLLATAPSQRGWALVGTLLGFSWWYVAGSFNFTLGLGLLCAGLAIWWRRRENGGAASLTLLALTGAVVLAVHLFAALMLLAVVGLDVCLAAYGLVRRVGDRAGFLRRLRSAGAVTGGVALLWLSMQWATAGSPVRSPDFEWRDALSQFKNLASPFLVFSLPQLAVMGIGYAIALAGLVAQHRSRRLLDPFVLSAPVFVALYLLSPRTWNIDLRWLPPAYILPFCATTWAPPPRRRTITWLFAFCVLHSLTVAWYARVIRHQLHDFDIALAQLPRGARVLPLVSDDRRYRVRPYYHYAMWHTIRTSGRVGGLFSRDGAREGDGTYTHLSHFEVEQVPYFPLYDWGTTIFDPLDCGRIARDYDYVIQAGQDPRARSLIERCATPAFIVGDIAGYRVARTSRPKAVP